MIWVWFGLGCYLLIGIFFTLLMILLDDPYGHFTTGEDWLRATEHGLFWLPYILWMLMWIVWYSLKDWWYSHDGYND